MPGIAGGEKEKETSGPPVADQAGGGEFHLDFPEAVSEFAQGGVSLGAGGGSHGDN